ncbi:MAG: type IVB secretion system protein IcmB/DotO [Alphaproteobacteria bacterium]
MGFADFIDQILAVATTGVRQPLESFCKIETIENENTFVAADGSLMTLLRVDGASRIVGDEELEEIVSGARLAFAPYLEKPGYAVQFWFMNDPDGSPRVVEQALSQAEQTARAIGLELNDLFEERKTRLPEFVNAEASYIALWTRMETLTKSQVDQMQEDEKKFNTGSPPGATAQPIKMVADSLRSRHVAFVRSMEADLKDLGLLCEVEEVHEALRAMRMCLYPDLATSNWKPSLPGDKVPARIAENGEARDVSSIVWPRIQDQMFVLPAEVNGATSVNIGNMRYGSIDMTLAPEETQPFSSLLARMGDTDIPWRISFLLEGGGMNALGLKSMLASILTWSAEDNKKIHNAIKELRANVLDGTVICKLRVSLATWAPADEDRTLRERVASLLRAVESWGNAQCTDMAGDPLEGVMSSALGMAVASTAPAAAAPVEDAVMWLPWGRSANPWRKGAVLFRTADGKPWPYQPGSHLQTSYIDLVFAPPGYGKSVLMNTVNLACCLAPSATTTVNGDLPRVAVIDIGPSSSGLVSLLQEALPERRRHEVAYHRLRMEPSNAINPFDTQLGCRYPMPTERAFIVNMLTLLSTAVGKDAPYDGITDLVGIVVDEVFKLYDDNGMPRPYSRGDDVEVDEAVDRHNIQLEDKPTWWEVVDAFFNKGHFHEAMMAQRHAVPLLHDIVVAARSRAVEDLFGETKAPTGETIVQAFARMISGAIREYPILAAPTRFDIGGARVCSLDLDEVAPRGGAAADRQTAVMYMLARHVLARDFYLNEETVKSMDRKVQPYHMKRAREMRETPKRLVYDEFHRTGAAHAVRHQVRIDIREGRKWGVQICLASQLLEDFDDQMVDQATGVWILGTGSDAAVKEATTRFNLGYTAQYVLRHRLSGPSRAGAPLLSMMRLKSGRFQQFLVNTLGPVELWAMSTTAEDAEIRKRLYDQIGPAIARGRLAKAFPGGTARPEIERRINDMMEKAGSDQDQAAGSVLDDIVAELASWNEDGTVNKEALRRRKQKLAAE